MKPAAFQGSYSDLKFIKSRSVCQVIIELPIETATAFVAAFGAPTPGAEVPVAIARLSAPASVIQEPPSPPEETAPVKERRVFHTLPLPQQAGLRCGDGAFVRFIHERYGPRLGSVMTVADAVREICGVSSRTELATDPIASSRWKELNREYEAWLHAPEHIG